MLFPLLPRMKIFILSWIIIPATFGQRAGTDSFSIPDDATREARNLYSREMGPDQLIYQGKLYLRNGAEANGFPFAFRDSAVDGSVYYDGNIYSIPLLYDIVQDEVVTRDFEQKNYTILSRAKLPGFTLGDRTFIYINDGTGNNLLPGAGYYQRIMIAPYELLIRRRKKLIPPGRFEDIPTYAEDVQYFLHIEHKYLRISNENSLVNAFGDKKQALQALMKKENIKFNSDKESAIVQITEAYIQMSK